MFGARNSGSPTPTTLSRRSNVGALHRYQVRPQAETPVSGVSVCCHSGPNTAPDIPTRRCCSLARMRLCSLFVSTCKRMPRRGDDRQLRHERASERPTDWGLASLSVGSGGLASFSWAGSAQLGRASRAGGRQDTRSSLKDARRRVPSAAFNGFIGLLICVSIDRTNSDRRRRQDMVICAAE